jgi:KipI family sensor histidine kinase inhibitor
MNLPQPQPVGENALVVRVAGASAGETLDRVRSVAAVIQAAAIPGVIDVVASPGRVTVAYEPLAVGEIETLRDAAAAASATAGSGGGEPTAHEIPVAYDGPDLDEVCVLKGIGRDTFVTLHTEPEYLVEAIGFLPGFGYLAGLPAGLATPRRATPRRLVPAGAVGIGGGQTGVYPFASPGGWSLVGRTDVQLFDVARPRPAVLAVGDRVRFVAAELPPAGPPEPPLMAAGTDGAITVIQPGLFTTVQDLGRPGHRAAGVPLSGGADRVALRLANLVVGNPEDAAVIECTLLGPTLRFERDAVVAVAGAEFPGLPCGVATRVTAGTELALGHATAGCRGYVAVAGGIDVPPVLESRSTLVAAGLGGFRGRLLRAGDRLGAGDGRLQTCPMSELGPACGADLQSAGVGAGSGHAVLRIIPGEQADAFGSGVWSRGFRASSRSDRMGLRLEGEPLPGAAAFAGMASVAVFPGTVQVPPDGRPIVLLADAQTIGGYSVLGQVIAADLPRAAQLRPNAEVRFEPVSLAEARAALRAQEAAIAAVREAMR